MSSDSPADPTLLLGLHGVFHRHPWIDRVLAEHGLSDEDMYALCVARAEAYGWSSTQLTGPPPDGSRWGHNDAGHDGTEDATVRQLAWLQVAVEEGLRGQRVPLLPVATVLDDALRHLGTYEFTGLHALVPVQLTPAEAYASLHPGTDWVATSGPGPAVPCRITLAAHPAAGLAPPAEELRARLLDITRGQLAAHPPTTPEALHDRAGLRRPLEGDVPSVGLRPVLSLRCSVPAWSLDTAVWAAEATAISAHSLGARSPVLITVSRGEDD
ncbi:hypothetical protein ACH4TS_11310 [Streptomyces albidoflavus]